MSNPGKKIPEIPHLPVIPAPGRAGEIVPVLPSRVSVVGGPAHSRHAPADEKASGLSLVLNVIRRWWLVAAPVGLVLATVASAVIWLLFKPQYEAAAWLKIDERAPYLAFDIKDDSGSRSFCQTQFELIRSPVVLGPVVARSEIAQLGDLKQQVDAIAWLTKQVKVSPVGESNLFKIIYQGKDANDAAAIVNAVTESYFKLRDQSDDERTQKVIELLEKKRDDRQKEVVRVRQQLSEMARELTGAETYTSKPDSEMPKRSMLADLQSRLVTTQVEEEVLAARIEAGERELQDRGPAEREPVKAVATQLTPSEAALRDTMVEQSIMGQPEVTRRMQVIVDKEERQREIERLMVGGKNNPAYVQFGRQINADRQDLVKLKESMRSSLAQQADAMLKAQRSVRETAESDRRRDEVNRMKSDQQALVAMEKGLQAKFDKEMPNVKQFKGETLELEFKRDELDRAEKVYELIAGRLLQIQTERMAPTRVSLLRKAEVPAVPIEAYPLKSLALAIIAGLCLPFGLAFAWENWVRRIGDSTDLPDAHGLTIVGEIAQMPRRMATRSRLDSRQGALELRVYQESIDNLQTTLTLSEQIGEMRFIAVTSAASGEGKTSVASQLAMSLARSIKERVLVIDGDMRSPNIHRVFQIDRDPGLAAVLAHECELADAIVTTWSDRVHLLPAGKLRGRPLALLADGAWPNLLARIPAEYRYVIIDTPPMLSAAEAILLAKAADAALICTMRDLSRTEQVMMVHNRLKSVGGRTVGVVLNGVPTKSYLYRYGNYNYLAKQDGSLR